MSPEPHLGTIAAGVDELRALIGSEWCWESADTADVPPTPDDVRRTCARYIEGRDKVREIRGQLATYRQGMLGPECRDWVAALDEWLADATTMLLRVRRVAVLVVVEQSLRSTDMLAAAKAPTPPADPHSAFVRWLLELADGLWELGDMPDYRGLLDGLARKAESVDPQRVDDALRRASTPEHRWVVVV